MVLKPAEQLKKRIQELEDEVATLTESSSNQLQEIDRLNSQLEQIDSLENNLKKERQKKKEQEKRIHQLEIDVADAVTELNKLKEGELKTSQTKLVAVQNEASILKKTIKTQEKEIHLSKQQNNQLMADSVRIENELSKQAYETELLRVELEEAKKAIPTAEEAQEIRKQNTTFKEFVKLKRELSQLQNENRKLKARLNHETANKNLKYLMENNTESS